MEDTNSSRTTQILDSRKVTQCRRNLSVREGSPVLVFLVVLHVIGGQMSENKI